MKGRELSEFISSSTSQISPEIKCNNFESVYDKDVLEEIYEMPSSQHTMIVVHAAFGPQWAINVRTYYNDLWLITQQLDYNNNNNNSGMQALF